jgi:cytochrome o ubiquinol oxidase subunit I
MVWAIGVITFLSFVVWLHHFFTMGSGGDVNAFFGITTMIIAIPTGVKIFNWLFTMYRGRVRFDTPMLWLIAFFTTFAIGGMTGVLMAIPAVDFQTHNTTFLVAHFHNVIIGGVLFGFFAGVSYWYPKVFGYRLHEGLGKVSFYLWVVGFYVAFIPLYIIGLEGFYRRTAVPDPVFIPWLTVALVGACIIGLGLLTQIIQVIYSYIHRDELRDKTGDPWDGRTMEWSLSSPAPFYNFAKTPSVSQIDDYWYEKQKWIEEGGAPRPEAQYEDIHMPKSTSCGFLIAMFFGLFGFAMIWHMLIPGIIGVAGMFICVVLKTFNLDVDYYVPGKQVHDIELAHYKEAHS